MQASGYTQEQNDQNIDFASTSKRSCKALKKNLWTDEIKIHLSQNDGKQLMI